MLIRFISTDHPAAIAVKTGAGVLIYSATGSRMVKTSEKGSKPPPKPGGGSLLDWFFQPSMLVRASLLAGAFALWPYIAQKLPSLGQRPEYRMDFRQIEISPAPSGSVPENLVEQVANLAEAPKNISILDENLAIEVARSFQRHPWVLKVVRVRKSFPASIVVELKYRRTVAMVQFSGRRIPIDENAVILPGADFSANDSTKFPLIQNVAPASELAAGSAWNDPAVVAAARLANVLGEHWKSLKLGAISIPRTATAQTDPNDIPLELVTQDGSRIVWGRPPGNDHPGELETSQKIRRMEKYLTDFGDYGKPQGPYEIDIRHWQEISRRPLTIEQAQAKPAKLPKNDVKARLAEGKKKTRL